jgi:hypothetical protein
MLTDLPGLHVDEERLAEVCRRHHIVKIELFGSRAKGTARPDSDVDLLLTFAEGHNPGLEYFGIGHELEAAFGCSVDYTTRQDLERSHNWVRRRSILNSAKMLYATAA